MSASGDEVAARPQVALKLATSLDGRIALASGDSKWITGPDSRAQVHRMRSEADTVITGVGTVLADDPALTAREGERLLDRQPRRAVFDTRLRTPPDARLFKAGGPVTIFCGPEANGHDGALRAAGAEIVPHLSGPDWIAALGHLRDLGCASVMIEAGAKMAASALAAGVVDRIEWFRAPMLIGGDGLPALAPLGLETLAAAPTFVRTEVRECGADLWESYQRAAI